MSARAERGTRPADAELTRRVRRTVREVGRLLAAAEPAGAGDRSATARSATGKATALGGLAVPRGGAGLGRALGRPAVPRGGAGLGRALGGPASEPAP